MIAPGDWTRTNTGERGQETSLTSTGNAQGRDVIMQNELSLEKQTDQTLAAILHFHATFNTHDVEAIMRLMSDDCVFENTSPSPDGTRIVGQMAVRTAWEDLFRDSPQAAFAIEDVFAVGDCGVIRWRYTWGTPTAETGHVRGVDIFRVRAGKVTEKLSYVKG